MLDQVATRVSRFFSFVYTHITRTRFTTIYFLFTFLFCLSQCITLSVLYSLNSFQFGVLHDLIDLGVPQNVFPANFYDGPGKNEFRLAACTTVPRSLTESHPKECTDIFKTGVMWNDTSTLAPDTLFKPNVHFSTMFGASTSSTSRAAVPLSGQCLLVMLYPRQILGNMTREDVSLLTVQLWIFVISLFGMIYESIPHIAAVLCVRLLSAIWSVYAITRTSKHLAQMTDLLHSAQSPCDQRLGVYPSYFQSRSAAEIPDLVLNIVALLGSVYLTMKLVKEYDSRGFNRVGASPEIKKIYRLFMTALASFQLAIIFLLENLGLWVYQLTSTAIGLDISKTYAPLYAALVVFTIIVIFPWAALGWYAIRQERKKLLFSFLGVAVLLCVSWSLMFNSWSYRWSFKEWPFFACMLILAGVAMLSSVIFAAICLSNFNKGLGHYLYVDTVLATLDFPQDIFEKDIEKSAGDDVWVQGLGKTRKFDSSAGAAVVVIGAREEGSQ